MTQLCLNVISIVVGKFYSGNKKSSASDLNLTVPQLLVRVLSEFTQRAPNFSTIQLPLSPAKMINNSCKPHRTSSLVPRYQMTRSPHYNQNSFIVYIISIFTSLLPFPTSFLHSFIHSFMVRTFRCGSYESLCSC